jgi:hypothetical protein
LPNWLRSLQNLQRASVVLTFFLMGATLFVYSTTMYTQQLWSKEFNQLKRMQRNERQMVAAMEPLKNQLIQQAEQPGSGLVPKSADNTIYLAPTAERPAPVAPALPNSVDAATTRTTPLGY